MSQSLRDCHAGSTAVDSGWMNGCMSLVLRSFFSYQVAVGSTMSEYRHVVLIRKSSVTSRSSLPSGALSCQTTSTGFASGPAPGRPKPGAPPGGEARSASGGCSCPRSLPWTPLLVPSRCFRKYSWPLPLDPSRFDRQTNRLRGQLLGWSGSSQLILSVPSFSDLTTYSFGSAPAACASRTTCSGLVCSCGAEGSQPMRSARTL